MATELVGSPADALSASKGVHAREDRMRAARDEFREHAGGPYLFEMRLTNRQYHALSDAGIFDGLRVELIYGRVYVMPAMGDEYLVGVRLVTIQFRMVFPMADFLVDSQLPRRLIESVSEPEPDITVIRSGNPRLADHPSKDVVLVVEVSKTSLGFDRSTKQALYAESGHDEYWIVNLVNRVLEVYRNPAAAGGDWRYGEVRTLGPDDSIAPLATPEKSIKVADLLP